MTVALSSLFGGALCLKNAYISAYSAFFCILPPVYTNFFQDRCTRVLGSGEMGGMLKHFGMSSIMDGMGWLRCRESKKTEGGGGLELVWHIGQRPSLKCLLFMLNVQER